MGVKLYSDNTYRAIINQNAYDKQMYESDAAYRQAVNQYHDSIAFGQAQYDQLQEQQSNLNFWQRLLGFKRDTDGQVGGLYDTDAETLMGFNRQELEHNRGWDAYDDNTLAFAEWFWDGKVRSNDPYTQDMSRFRKNNVLEGIYHFRDRVFAQVNPELYNKIRDKKQFNHLSKDELRNIRTNYNLLLDNGKIEEAKQYINSCLHEASCIALTEADFSTTEYAKMQEDYYRATGIDNRGLDVSPLRMERIAMQMSPTYRNWHDKRNWRSQKYIDLSKDEWEDIGQHYKFLLTTEGEKVAVGYLENYFQTSIDDNTHFVQRLAESDLRFTNFLIGGLAEFVALAYGAVGALGMGVFAGKWNTGFMFNNALSQFANDATQFGALDALFGNITEDDREVGGHLASEISGGKNIFNDPSRIIPELIAQAGFVASMFVGSKGISGAARLSGKGIAKGLSATGKIDAKAFRAIGRVGDKMLANSITEERLFNAIVVPAYSGATEGLLEATQTYNEVLSSGYGMIAEHLGIDAYNRHWTEDEVAQEYARMMIKNNPVYNNSSDEQQLALIESFMEEGRKLYGGYRQIIEQQAVDAGNTTLWLNSCINGPIHAMMGAEVFGSSIKGAIRTTWRNSRLGGKVVKLSEKATQKAGGELTKWGYVKAWVSPMLAEGSEEYAQNLIQSGSTGAADYFMGEYIDRFSNEDALDMISKGIVHGRKTGIRKGSHFWAGVSDELISESSAEAFILGALGGQFAIQRVYKIDDKGNKKIDWGKSLMAGNRNVASSQREAARDSESNAQLGQLIKNLTNGKNPDDVKTAGRLMASIDRMEQAMAANDVVLAKDERLFQLTMLAHYIQAHPNKGEFKSWLKSLEQIASVEYRSDGKCVVRDGKNYKDVTQDMEAMFAGMDKSMDDVRTQNMSVDEYKRAMANRMKHNAQKFLEIHKEVGKLHRNYEYSHPHATSDQIAQMVYSEIALKDKQSRYQQVKDNVDAAISKVYGSDHSKGNVDDFETRMKYSTKAARSQQKKAYSEAKAKRKSLQSKLNKYREKNQNASEIEQLENQISQLDKQISQFESEYQSYADYVDFTQNEIARMSHDERNQYVYDVLMDAARAKESAAKARKAKKDGKEYTPYKRKYSVKALNEVNQFIENCKSFEFDDGSRYDDFARDLADVSRLEKDVERLKQQVSEQRANLSSTYNDAITVDKGAQRMLNKHFVNRCLVGLGKCKSYEDMERLLNDYNQAHSKEVFSELMARLAAKNIPWVQRYIKEHSTVMEQLRYEIRLCIISMFGDNAAGTAILNIVEDAISKSNNLQEFMQNLDASIAQEKNEAMQFNLNLFKSMVQVIVEDLEAAEPESAQRTNNNTSTAPQEPTVKPQEPTVKPQEPTVKPQHSNGGHNKAFANAMQTSTASEADAYIDTFLDQLSGMRMSEEELLGFNEALANAEDGEVPDLTNVAMEAAYTPGMLRDMRKGGSNEQNSEEYQKYFDAAVKELASQLPPAVVGHLEQLSKDYKQLLQIVKDLQNQLAVRERNEQAEYQEAVRNLVDEQVREDAATIQSGRRTQPSTGTAVERNDDEAQLNSEHRQEFIQDKDGKWVAHDDSGAKEHKGLVDFLKQLGAYEFVNSGKFADIINAKPDTPIRFFMCKGKYDTGKYPSVFMGIEIANASKTSIEIDGKHYQIVGTLGYNQNKRAANQQEFLLRSVRNDITNRDEYTGATDGTWFTTGDTIYNDVTGEDTPATTKVKFMYSGTLILSTGFQDVTHEWMSGQELCMGVVVGNDIRFSNPEVAENLGISAEQLDNIAKKQGMYIMFIKGADGKYYPRYTTTKMFNEDELVDLNSPFCQYIKGLLKIICNNNLSDYDRALSKYELQSVLYEIERNPEDKTQPAHTISFKGDSVNINNVGMAGYTNIGKGKSADEKAEEVFSKLLEMSKQGHPLRINISVARVGSDANYRNMILSSGILISPMERASNGNGGFVVYPTNQVPTQNNGHQHKLQQQSQRQSSSDTSKKRTKSKQTPKAYTWRITDETGRVHEVTIRGGKFYGKDGKELYSKRLNAIMAFVDRLGQQNGLHNLTTGSFHTNTGSFASERTEAEQDIDIYIQITANQGIKVYTAEQWFSAKNAANKKTGKKVSKTSAKKTTTQAQSFDDVSAALDAKDDLNGTETRSEPSTPTPTKPTQAQQVSNGIEQTDEYKQAFPKQPNRRPNSVETKLRKGGFSHQAVKDRLKSKSSQEAKDYLTKMLTSTGEDFNAVVRDLLEC